MGEICKAAGALVTENDRLWRVAHALTGKNYKIPGSSNLQHFLLKRLLVEKSIDVVAPSNAFVRELEETCINEPDLRFNIPKNMEESKVKFEYKPTFTAQSKRKQEQQDEGHGGQDAFGNIDVSDQRLRWYSVTELSGLICELCVRELQVNKSKVLGSNSKFNPTSCVNCCANCNADTNGVVRSTEGRKLYTRLFAECVVAIPDLQNLNRKRNKPSAQLGAPTKEVLDIMNKIKPRHPRSLMTEPAAQGSKRKATEGEGDGLGQVPDPSRSSQPNAEKEEKKQRVIDGRKAALGFLESMEKCMGEMEICMRCANLAHDGDKKIRELLSSDHVSSDEEMGDTEEPSSSTSKERKKGGQAGKETIEMHSYTINLVEMADTAEGGELQCGGVDLTHNPCGDNRTFKTTLERGCDTIPCYIPKYGDVSDVHMPWAYASIVDPRYFPKGANLEQVDVMQLGKSVSFCVAPFDGSAPLCKIGDDRSVFATKDQANQLSHNLCRVLRHKIGNCRGSVFRCDEGGWVDIDAVIDDRNNDIFPPTTSRAKRYMGIMEVIKWQESGQKKSRFQVLAARFPSIMNPNDTRAAREEMNNAGLDRDDIDRMFNRCDGWYRPWCIRVTTGHSDFGFMSSSALANRYSARMGDSLGGAFHVTYVENLGMR